MILREVTPKTLVEYVERNEPDKEMTIEYAEMLLGYMEGHGYAIGIDKDDKLFWVDKTDDVKVDPIDDLIRDIYEIIQRASEWNYDILDQEYDYFSGDVTAESIMKDIETSKDKHLVTLLEDFGAL